MSLFCRCGASWHGKHVAGAQRHILRDGCEGVSHERYKVLHKCKCPECEEARRQERQLARAIGKTPNVVVVDEAKFNALIDRDLEHYAGKLAKRALRAARVGTETKPLSEASPTVPSAAPK